MSAKEPYSETDALRAALDVADKKRGRRAPAWLTSTEPARPPRLHPEPTGHSAEDLIRALHGDPPEPTDDDEPDDDLPAAA
jgi:hypothetical protein